MDKYNNITFPTFLTVEQLKQKDKQPVFVVCLKDGREQGWYIVGSNDWNMMGYNTFAGYGSAWAAYDYEVNVNRNNKMRDLYNDAKLCGWTPEKTIEELYKTMVNFPNLSICAESRCAVNEEIIGVLRQGIYAIINLVTKYNVMKGKVDTLNEKITDIKSVLIKYEQLTSELYTLINKGEYYDKNDTL